MRLRLPAVIGLVATLGSSPGLWSPPPIHTDPGNEPSAASLSPALQTTYRQAVVEPDPQAGVVALAVRFPGGAARDPRGAEGTAFLLGRVLERQGNETLAPLGAAVQVTVSADEFVVTLLAVPDRWRDAVRDLEGVLYRGAPSQTEVDRARSAVLDMIAFEAGAPVRAFEIERSAFVLGPQDPAARPTLGTPSTLPAVGPPELASFRASNLRPEEAVLAATGPIEAAELSALLGTNVRDLVAESRGTARPTRAPAATVDSLAQPPAARPTARADSLPPPPVLLLDRSEAPPFELPQEPLGPPAWTTGQRTIVDRELTSTWISLAVPFPMGAPPLLLDFLGHLVLEALTPSPPDPYLYDAQVSTMQVRGAPVLLVTASVDPRATSRWEDRLRGSIENIAEAPPEGAFFELARRRFRSSILFDLALPENRAAWLAREVAGGRSPVPDPGQEVWRIRRPAVASLARAAGPARALLFGPESMMDR